MSNSIFSPLEIDAIGEISNISLGSSATAISNMLDHRVDLTTPSVSVVNAEDLSWAVLNRLLAWKLNTSPAWKAATLCC